MAAMDKESQGVQKPDESQHVEPSSSVSIEQISISVKAPDGGWGWVVCFACFMSHVLVDGLLYSFGVVFVELLDYFKGGKGETAVIASLNQGICLLVGPVAAMFMNKFGCRAVVIAGTFIASGSLIISIFAPNVQFLYFSLGATLGTGYGLIYLPSIVCVSHYFNKHRALATGIGVSGAGVGTFIFSPVMRFLIETYNWRGAILIQAGIVLNCLVCGLVYRPIKLTDPRKDGNNRKMFRKPAEDISNSCSDFPEASAPCLVDNSCSPFKSTPDQHQLPAPCLSENENHIERDDFSDITDLPEEKDNRSDIENFESNAIELSPLNHRETTSEKAHDAVETVLPEAEDQSKSTDVEKNLGKLQQIKENLMSSFHLEMFRNVAFCMFLVSTFFYSLGYYVPYVYLPDTAREAGVDDLKASFLLSTIGITNTIGRVLFGFLSDQKWVNRLTLYSTALVICGVGTCFGPLLMSFELLLLYCVIFGVFSGVTISLTSVIISDIVGLHKLADAFGVSNLFGGIASFLGPPLAGWIYDMSGDYIASYVTAGMAICISGIMLYFVPCIEKITVFNKEAPSLF